MKLDYIEGNDMIKQIEKGSLSHKFLSLIFEPYEVRDGINICDVPWRVLKKLAACIVLCLTIGFCIVALLRFIIAMLSTILAILVVPSWLHFGFPMFGVVIWGMLCFVILFFVIVETFEGNIPIMPAWLNGKDKEPNPPSLVSIWWKSFKEKTCVKIIVGEK